MFNRKTVLSLKRKWICCPVIPGAFRMTEVQQERRCSAGRKPRKHEPCRMQSTSMWALWCGSVSQEQVRAEPGSLGRWDTNTTEPLHVSEGCTSRKSSFRNISDKSSDRSICFKSVHSSKQALGTTWRDLCCLALPKVLSLKLSSMLWNKTISQRFSNTFSSKVRLMLQLTGKWS